MGRRAFLRSVRPDAKSSTGRGSWGRAVKNTKQLSLHSRAPLRRRLFLYFLLVHHRIQNTAWFTRSVANETSRTYLRHSGWLGRPGLGRARRGCLGIQAWRLCDGAARASTTCRAGRRHRPVPPRRHVPPRPTSASCTTLATASRRTGPKQ